MKSVRRWAASSSNQSESVSGTMPSGSAGKRGVAAGVKVRTSAVGVDEARRVQTVAAHHAADGVRDQFGHGVLAEAGPLVFFREFAAVAVGGVHREGDLLDGNIRG